MSTSLHTAVVTPQCLAAATAAGTNGVTLAFTHMAIGAAQWDPEAVGADLSGLQDRREVVELSGGVHNGNTFTLYGTFMAGLFSGAAYEIGEMAAYIGHPDQGGVCGVLFSSPDATFGKRGPTLKNDFSCVATFALDAATSAALTVEFDEAAATAAAILYEHTHGATDPHTQYVRHDGQQALSAASQAVARANIAAEKAGDALRRDGTLAMLAPLVLSGNAAAALQAVPYQQLVAYVSAQIALLPSDKYLQGLGGYDAATNKLTLNMSDGSTVQVDMSGLVADALSTHETNASHLSQAAVQQMIDSAVGVALRKARPLGSVGMTYDNWVPDGALWADGQEVNRADYPDLWAWASNRLLVVSEADWASKWWTNYSVGNGSTTFRMPKLHHEFLRFVDGTSRSAGSRQDQELLSHAHTGTTGWNGDHTHTVEQNSGVNDGGNDGSDAGGAQVGGDQTSVAGSHTHTFTTDSTGGGENRPRNVGLRAFIWY